ncbi:glycosyltransferase family 2 protein [Algoriphagus sp. D3-2-R+10]|uniref:glycosyltransferase family 2 protein n=1 Tax=Algoriphagus aurantiacus TaxID=3103948 RepID=UPI002B3A0EAB|nr:glycosyltransferase family 2 protein [Algoriphagus sp. D3-2-R+10]MEB2775208.1 glycosyltransferase family 2 protein [Algoriphagus sp. D3-2-R+10]
MSKTISVVLPNFNGKDLLENYLPFTFQALKNTDCDYEIIVVDDASFDDSVLFLTQEHPDITLIRNPENKGFSYSCNIGILKAKHDLVLLLNSDVKLMPDYLEKLIPYFEDSNTFGVMGKILDRTGLKIEVAAKIPRFNGFKLKSDKQVHPKSPFSNNIPTTFLSGANCLVDRQKILELEGFDEIYSPFYTEDLDLSIRAWKLGWKCYYEHEATCIHLGSHTTKTYFQKTKIKEIYFRNRMLFHAIHIDRKDVKRWQLYLLFLEVLPKVLLGQFWILKSYSALKMHKQQIRSSRKKIRDLMVRKQGRKSIEDVSRDIHELLINKELIVL